MEEKKGKEKWVKPEIKPHLVCVLDIPEYNTRKYWGTPQCMENDNDKEENSTFIWTNIKI